MAGSGKHRVDPGLMQEPPRGERGREEKGNNFKMGRWGGRKVLYAKPEK